MREHQETFKLEAKPQRRNKVGDSLSPGIFSFIMDELVNSVKNKYGYRMGNKRVLVVYYAADVVSVQ